MLPISYIVMKIINSFTLRISEDDSGFIFLKRYNVVFFQYGFTDFAEMEVV